MLVYPGQESTIRPFEEIWRTRTCNFTERWFVLTAVLRTLNVPARIRAGTPEMWLEGKWLPLAR
jgi:hypothetical protein